MRVFLFLILFLGSKVYGQNKIQPVLEIGYGKNLIGEHYQLNVLEVGAGIKLNEHFCFQVNLSQAKNTGTITPYSNKQFETNILSISTFFRLLKDNFMISPTISIDVGGEVNSNARGNLTWFAGGSIILPDNYSHEPMVIYNKGQFFGKIKLQADIKLWDFNILIGGGYNYFRIDVDYLKPEYIGYDLVGHSIDENRIGEMAIISGFSLDASLRYTLNFGEKKKVLK